MKSYIATLNNIETGEVVTTVVIEAETEQQLWASAEKEAEEQGLYVGDVFER